MDERGQLLPLNLCNTPVDELKQLAAGGFFPLGLGPPAPPPAQPPADLFPIGRTPAPGANAGDFELPFFQRGPASFCLPNGGSLLLPDYRLPTKVAGEDEPKPNFSYIGELLVV